MNWPRQRTRDEYDQYMQDRLAVRPLRQRLVDWAWLIVAACTMAPIMTFLITRYWL